MRSLKVLNLKRYGHKSRLKWKWWYTTALLGIIIVLTSVFLILRITNDYAIGNRVYKEAAENYVQHKEHHNFGIIDAGGVNNTNNSSIWWNDVDVDLPAISAEYPDVVAWIYFENEDISYPIAYAKGNNNKYLHTYPLT